VRTNTEPGKIVKQIMDFLRNLQKEKEMKTTYQYREQCAVYQNNCERLENFAQQYVEISQTAIEMHKREAAYIQYASGGEVFHRGYYCPSPSIDFFSGKSNRGRIITRPTKKSKISYIYYFDRLDRLLCVCKNPNTQVETKEMIISAQDSFIGLTFDQQNNLTAISECKYSDEKIQSYSMGIYYYGSKHISDYMKETYTYNESILQSTDMFDFIPATLFLRHNKIVFQYDAGKIVAYQSLEYDVREDNLSSKEVHTYEIPKKGRNKL